MGGATATVVLTLVLLASLSPLCRAQQGTLSYLTLDARQVFLPALDDGISAAINIPEGIPFGESHPMTAWIATNGILSFGEAYSHYTPEIFPGVSTSVQNGLLIAPFWDDVDISGGGGNVSYQTFSSSDEDVVTTDNLNTVNSYVNSMHGDGNFTGAWMLVASWDHVSPYPHGSFQSEIFFPDIFETNTFQAVLITDHTSKSYTIFTYKCGDLNWARGPTIGYNAASAFYANHPNSGADDADSIDCTNGPDTYYNLWYNISVENFTTPEPPTPVEPDQETYLQWLNHTEVNAGQVDACDDCSSDEIQLPVDVPFGNYYHNSIYVGTNGIISFGLEFPHYSPSLFPTTSAETYYDFAIAPYWTDNDARLNGRVSWEMYSTGDGDTTDDIIQSVNEFINANTNETDFAGTFLFVSFWEGMHPYPAGASPDQAAPYLNFNNTYQGLIITNGTKTYAVLTFRCEYLNWAGNAVIGFNAGSDYFDNHPLAGGTISNLVACVHLGAESEWNNVIYDLVPNPDQLTDAPTPPPFTSIGTCAAAGITECCEGDSCIGEPQDCFCDTDCFFFADCCQDISDICTFEPPPDTDYLIFASHSTINYIDFNGENFNILLGPLSGGALGIDFHFNAGKMYWTDYLQNAIFMSDLSGENVITLVDTQLDVTDDVAVDWINDKLYWVDSVWARIEVMDISDGSNRERAELIKLSNHTIPRGIAVDPNVSLMFWTDWGEVPKIECASMDGKYRTVIVSTDLGEPYGITIDYANQRIYWADNDEDRIEYSDYTGGGRTQLVGASDGVVDPFGLTIYGDLLYWTDWQENAVYGTHKIHGTNPLGGVTEVIQVYTGLLVNPNGIEAVSATRQPGGTTNACVDNPCEHLCLLSIDDLGYSCVCPLNYILNTDGTTCIVDPNPTVPPVNNGTCAAAGYTSCCEIGYCAGYPASCFCDADCYGRGDCCHDSESTCPPIIGSCIDAGFDTCCITGDCAGVPADSNCYCDAFCLEFDDCCDDFQQICPGGTPSTEPTLTPPAAYLEYLDLSSTGVESVQLPPLDDGLSEQIDILDGLPFGDGHPIAVWIANNGIFSFNEAYAHWSPEVFPGFSSSVQNGLLVTPFWDDVDISGNGGGSIYYQVHTAASGNASSVQLINQVNTFINNVQDGNFTGVWMLVGMWDHVHPYPHGTIPNPSIFPDVNEENTYQAIVITDHTSQAYAVFTYKCGDLNWARGPTIGFNAASLFYANYDLTGGTNADIIDCFNSPNSEYFNLVYNITAANFVPPPPLPTSEPPQATYLEWLEHTGLNAGTVPACDDCSSGEISLLSQFPFGNYYHNSTYLATNGIVSFGIEFPHFSAALFPTESAATYFDFAVAPYWADNDARLNGLVSWEMYSIGDGAAADDIIQRVNDFINANTVETDFEGNFIFVGFWEEMHPYPAGASPIQAEPYLDSNNTYQAVLITDGNQKSYAVITFKCDALNWAGEATIGFNAGGDYYENHPLSGLSLSNAVACVHNDSVWNNVIYNLVPDPSMLTNDPTPEPPTTIGSCVAAGYEACCVGGEGDFCIGEPQDCFCDVDCFLLNDCCADATDICTFDPPVGDYFLVASHSTINHVDLNGENFNIFISQLAGGAYGLNFHYSAGYVYWTDYVADTIYRANISTGLDMEEVVTTHLPEPEDIAVDWVSNKLYWIDSLWARIEVMDIESGQRAELIRTNNHSIPRGLALDPLAKYIFWTDWGEPALIERASMDGKGRVVLHSGGINQPFGITCDYASQRVYWSDAGYDRIEFSFYNGSDRQVLISASDGVEIPFDLTIYGDLLYWTDWQQNAIYGTHKIHGTNPLGNFTDVVVIYEGLVLNPNGIEAISADRQPAGINTCQDNLCEHFCLLSSVGVDGQSCMCASGFILNEDQLTCSVDPNPTAEPTSNGSCVASGYSDCCEVGFCGGYPANCFCDANCYGRGDCCDDITTTCTTGLGSCIDAGYDTCCVEGFCAGVPEDANCFCDSICLEFGDCCADFQDICPGGTPTTEPTLEPPAAYLEYLSLGGNGVPTLNLPNADDGISASIPVPNMPFGNSIQTSAYVANNGIFSFGEPYSSFSTEVFPGISAAVQNSYLVTPFWDDNDISIAGSIYYETHQSGSIVQSNTLLQQVSTFISTVRSISFSGSWLLVGMWDQVHPWPHGSSTNVEFYPDLFDNNTFQGIVITDGTTSFAVFTFKCGDLNWARSPTIGYNAASDFYENYELTGSTGADVLDCHNFPTSDYFNLVYNISVENIVTTEPPSTEEPPQQTYLQWLNHTEVNAGQVDACDDCSSEEIQLPVDVPFGNYYHNSIHMTTNGLVSFGSSEFPTFAPALFPTDSIETYHDYVAAPYWADNDARLNGRVSWEMYSIGDSDTTDDIIQSVNEFIRVNEHDDDFDGTFLFVGFWEGMHPYPAGADPTLATPYLNNNNTYQAIIITDTEIKTYAIYTYQCGALNWAGEGIIGFNAGGDYYDNYPLSGLPQSNAIACVHANVGSVWNNQVYNLVPNPGAFTGLTTPEPPSSLGSCAAAGYTECCVDEDGVTDCLGGDPFDCYCDQFCYFLDDCCYDINDICIPPTPEDSDYLLIANHYFIIRSNLDGSELAVVLGVDTGGAVGIQFHVAQNKMFYSDYVDNHIYSATLDTGADPELLLNDNVEVPEDLAVDWVANNLYWTDSFWSRIEVMDLDTRERAELIRTGNHSIPRAIVVDPMTKYMYWTDWGEVAKIEKAGMDGHGRTVIINTDLVWPNGLAIDYEAQRLYWADANLDKIEYSSVDGTGRTLLETGATGLLHPYALTIEGDLLYWTDWQNNSIYATHKIHGTGQDGDISLIVGYLVVNPNGIEAVGPNQQPDGINVCESNDCSHLCLLSVVDTRGYSCACPLGTELANDGTSCIMTSTSTPLPEFGSCVAAGYTTCCETGYCAGYPANCFCDRDCHARGDCCSDAGDRCLDYDSYLLFANHFFILRCNLDGTNPITLLTRESGGAAGIEFDLAPGQRRMYYTDYVTNQILVANIDGTGSQPIMDDELEVPEGLALDWVGHNLYWTDAFWARIEVMDLNTTERAEVLQTGPNTVPREIAVDPRNRNVFWTDWGAVAKVERASMDGQNRFVVIDTELVSPYGITIDYAEQKVYWMDAALDKVEYANFDGSGRVTLITLPEGFGLGVPYSLTLSGDYLYWSEWDDNSLYSVHKTEGGNVSLVLGGLLVNPNGIQAVSASRRLYSENPCASNDCTHLCLLSSATDIGYSCACPLGMELANDGVNCVQGTATPIPELGSCKLYTDCCAFGYCAGYPPNCFCDHDCHSRGDCCRDVADVCPEFEGSCVAAGYTTCCTAGVCIGEPDVGNCYCDVNCLTYDDCCDDFFDICSDATPTPSSTTPMPSSSVPSSSPSSSSSSSSSPSSSPSSTSSSSSSPSSSSSSSSTAGPQPTGTPTVPGLFQLHFLGLDDCSDWIDDDTVKKMEAIADYVSDAVKDLCGCDVDIVVTYTNTSLMCYEDVDKTTVTFRGWISDRDLLDYIETWVENTDEITVAGTTLKLDSDCQVRINQLDDKSCDVGSGGTGRQTSNNGARVAAPIVVILVVIAAVVIALMVVVFIYWRRKHGKSYNIFGSGGDEVGIINYDGSESVSISDPGAAELTSMKKESLAFDEKEGAAPLSSDRETVGKSFQNPIYGTADFAFTSEDGDSKPEKTMPTPADFAPPYEPLKTTSAASPASGGYQPALVEPKDDESEPRYATVLPKHKRATAKPFAADEESDDDFPQDM